VSVRDPLTRQRSDWADVGAFDCDGAPGRAYRRNVHDGFLSALLTQEPHGQHLSVAHHNGAARKDRARRYPTWDELADARYRLCAPGVDMVMILPPLDDYVACHPTTFHLHQVDNLPATATDRAKTPSRDVSL
jgi:hypothetical protein